MHAYDVNERFSANYHDPSDDRRGGWTVTEWLQFTHDSKGNVIGRSGKKVTSCISEEVAINLATELTLKWRLQNEQD